MCRKLLSLLFLSICMSVSATDETNPQMVFFMVQMSLQNGDIDNAQKMLDTISSKCEQSDDWEVRYRYYLLLGELSNFRGDDLKDANRYYFKALDAYPSSLPFKQEHMQYASMLCWGLYDDGDYEQAEELSTKCLIRGSALADSCLYSSLLFSVLAKCYEHKGDTIMPQHFHEKAQDLCIHYNILTGKPDSVDIYMNRHNTFKLTLKNSKPYFSKKSPYYLLALNQYCYEVAKGGNRYEVKYLAEKAIKLATDSSLTQLNGACDAYFHLIYCYASDNQANLAEAMLERATDYFGMFPEKLINEPVLIAQIGKGLMDSRHYAEAIKYFERTKNMWNDDQKVYRDETSQLIRECKKNL